MLNKIMVIIALILIVMSGISVASSTTTVFNSDGTTNTYIQSGDSQIQVGHYDPRNTPGYEQYPKYDNYNQHDDRL